MSLVSDYLYKEQLNLSTVNFVRLLIQDAVNALREMPLTLRLFHLFWLLGPLIMLIERSPADAWLSIIAVTFLIKCIVQRDVSCFRHTWVKAVFIFWMWCLFTGLVSEHVLHSIGETAAWVRFPLFAIATAYWLGKDERLLYAMLFATAVGLMLMCGILAAEVMIEGQKGGRLTWPYGDSVPGNYVAKVGFPILTITVAAACKVRGHIAHLAGLFAFITIIISLVTGERINFLIRACGSVLAALVCRPLWHRILILVLAEITAIIVIFSALPGTAARYTTQFLSAATEVHASPWWYSLNGGWQIAKDNLLVGIGVANYSVMSQDLLEGVAMTKPQPHPHNYYLQLLAETGVIGLLLGVLFIASIIVSLIKVSFEKSQNLFYVTAWIIPLGVFWPISTSADFFGQWNNIFMWSGVALALCASGKVRNV